MSKYAFSDNQLYLNLFNVRFIDFIHQCQHPFNPRPQSVSMTNYGKGRNSIKHNQLQQCLDKCSIHSFLFNILFLFKILSWLIVSLINAFWRLSDNFLKILQNELVRNSIHVLVYLSMVHIYPVFFFHFTYPNYIEEKIKYFAIDDGLTAGRPFILPKTIYLEDIFD